MSRFIYVKKKFINLDHIKEIVINKDGELYIDGKTYGKLKLDAVDERIEKLKKNLMKELNDSIEHVIDLDGIIAYINDEIEL